MRNIRLLLLLVLVLGVAALLTGCPANNQPAEQAEDAQKSAQGEQEQKQEETNTVEAPRRGCPSCHVRVSEEKDYSLLAEAQSRTKAKGSAHPVTAPDGTKMDETTSVDVCLQCHKPGENEKGAMAPLQLRTIVHPAHMVSETFKEKYGGNCFTCHDVNGTGTFTLLSEKVETTEKGIPTTVPIPGSLPPSETGT